MTATSSADDKVGVSAATARKVAAAAVVKSDFIVNSLDWFGSFMSAVPLSYSSVLIGTIQSFVSCVLIST